MITARAPLIEAEFPERTFGRWPGQPHGEPLTGARKTRPGNSGIFVFTTIARVAA